MDQIIKKNASIVGLIGAVLYSALIIYIWKSQAWANISLGIFYGLIPIPFGIIAQWWSKTSLNSYITLKQGVLAYFLCLAIIMLGDFITSYLIYVVIDPAAQEAANSAAEALIDQNENALAREQIFKKPEYSFMSYLTGFVSKLLVYTIVGILTALIFRKEIIKESHHE